MGIKVYQKNFYKHLSTITHALSETGFCITGMHDCASCVYFDENSSSFEDRYCNESDIEGYLLTNTWQESDEE